MTVMPVCIHSAQMMSLVTEQTN